MNITIVSHLRDVRITVAQPQRHDYVTPNVRVCL